MAAKTIKKSETVVWLPPRSVGERSFASEPTLVALVHDSEGSRYTRLSLDALPAARQVTLVFDARDVTLVHVKLPPLSGAKLRLAVPNALEDRLLQDPQTCLFALGPKREADGASLVAVTDRAWLDFVVGAFERRGIRVVRAIPAQLAVPFDPDIASIVCVHDGLALRTDEYDGLGWTAGERAGHRIEALNSALGTVLIPPGEDTGAEPAAGELAGEPVTGRAAGLPAKSLVAYIEDDTWNTALVTVAQQLKLPVTFETLPVPQSAVIDLLSGRGGSSMGRRVADIDWRAWRLPAVLALACCAVFLIGLNLHWGKLAAEKSNLRADMEQRFRETFPESTVVVDPLLQMEREVARMRAGIGQTGPEDFMPLMTRFAQALGPQGNDALTSLEYRDGRLIVNFEPAVVASRSVREKLQLACKQLGLELTFEPGRDSMAFVGML